MLARCLEVIAVLDQLDPERAHRGVLLAAVAMGDDDGSRQSVASRGESDRLPVIAARRADHTARPLRLLAEVMEIDQPAAHLESAGRRVVFMLYPDLGAHLLAQQRPGILRGRCHRPVDDRSARLELCQRWIGCSGGHR